MSFEESLKTLADSNLRLAAAMDKYADTIIKFGLKVEEANTGTLTAETEAEEPKKGRGRPAKAKPEPTPEPEVEADDDDGFGEDEEEVVLDFATVKQALKDVAAHPKLGKPKALDILDKAGYKSIPDIKEKDFRSVYDACQKLLK